MMDHGAPGPKGENPKGRDEFKNCTLVLISLASGRDIIGWVGDDTIEEYEGSRFPDDILVKKPRDVHQFEDLGTQLSNTSVWMSQSDVLWIRRDMVESYIFDINKDVVDLYHEHLSLEGEMSQQANNLSGPIRPTPTAMS